jgi:hypothetical protein
MAGKVLNGARRFAFNQIKTHEGLTCRELEARPSQEGHAIPEGTIQRRVSELVNAGYIKQGERRICEITGRLAATLWTL